MRSNVATSCSKVLVFGSEGFIGKKTVAALLAKGYSVITIDMAKAHINVDLATFPLESLLDHVGAADRIGIINCAGYNQKVEDVKSSSQSDWYIPERWQNCINLNLTLPFKIAKFAELCLEKTKGRVDVIFLGSLYASKSPNNYIYEGLDGMAFKEVEYVASKHGLVGLTKSLNALNLSDRLRFNCVSPGAVEHMRMADQFKINFTRYSSGSLNDVDEIASLLAELLFNSWSLFQGANIQAHGGAFN
jgi:NAD(P)-dependent dehydrogenase (short-subunit alcohol dehydrogenase family)